MSYDQKCYDLAKDFLGDESPFTEAEVEQLAQDIQDAIESFLNFGRKKAEPPKHG